MSKFKEFFQTKYTYWTYEMLRDEASKYNTKKDFRENSTKAYSTAYNRGILDEITKHMEQRKIWTKEEAEIESRNYKNKLDFQNNSPAYSQSYKNGWLNDFFDNSLIRWTKEMAHQEALKYETKVEFRNGSPKAYGAAQRHKWMDDITKHMSPIGSLYNRMVYVYEFTDNHVYVGLTCNKKRRHNAHTNIDKILSPVAKHIIKTGLDPIYKEESTYITAIDAQNLEHRTLERYRSEGWVILNTAKTGGLGKPIGTPLTMEKVRDLASSYPTRIAFRRAHSREYRAAHRYGWLEDVFMNIPKQDRIKWNYIKTKEEALKYVTKTKFKLGCERAYSVAIRNKWINEFFPEKPNNYRKVYDKVNDITFDTIKSAADYHGIRYANLLHALTKAKVNNTGLEFI
jgi:hypothetical protein